MQNLTIFEQLDPYNPDVSRFAVCVTIDGSGGLNVLSNHKTREIASEWIQHYLQRNELKSFDLSTGAAERHQLEQTNPAYASSV